MPTETIARHTAGPWQVHEHAPYSVWGFGKSEGTQIAACRVLLDDGTWDGYFPTIEDECVANARLIASAPELLAVCRRFLEMYDDVRDSVGPSVRAAIEHAERAIAKAEGGAQ